MFIKRIQVEEGFLSGLDLTFAPGFNVLIGPRGTGKTSVIELIRYCLDVPAITDLIAQSSKVHALSILGAGSVTVTLDDGNEDFTLRRTAEAWTTSGPKTFTKPVILSQNEIESIGLQASGRLRLIDSIRESSFLTESGLETALVSHIRSQTEERRTAAAELQSIRKQLRELDEQLKEVETVKKEHAEAMSGIEKAQPQNQRLAQLNIWLSNCSVKNALYARLLTSLDQRRTRLRPLVSNPFSVEAWPIAAASEDPLDTVRKAVNESQDAIQVSEQRLTKAIDEVHALSDVNSSETITLDEESRNLRRQLESLKQGAGDTARKLAVIQEKIGQQSALRELEKAKLAQLGKVQALRKEHLDALEMARARRFSERAKVVEQLNSEFGPWIKISIERAGQNTDYASAIVAAMRGSGLKMTDITSTIADRMSPREFVEFIETENVDELASISGLSQVRAARIIERIKEEGVEGILTANIEDGVTLSLLDGSEYKTTEELSTGQRCTVVLPLLLKQQLATVIVDQPEDHLDNAFIVETLVKVIGKKNEHGQLIFSTHNANIPVLGGADQVTMMGSDGNRGFVLHSAPLENLQSITAITSIMEGGIEAFRKRGDFYTKQR
jgi:DNA repair exonuclease SbcCD ATPase subunit